MKKYLSFVLILVLALSLTACADSIPEDDAKTLVRDFLEMVEEGDYTSAEVFLHPDHPAGMQAYFEGIEQAQNVDFSGLEIEEYTDFHASDYDIRVGGASDRLTVKLSLSGQTVVMKIKVVNNADGYGIYDLDIVSD